MMHMALAKEEVLIAIVLSFLVIFIRIFFTLRYTCRVSYICQTVETFELSWISVP